jgi:hypothetical protein
MTEEPRGVEHEPQVLQGDDDVLRQPASPIALYARDPCPPRDRRAWKTMRLAWIPILIVIGLII